MLTSYFHPRATSELQIPISNCLSDIIAHLSHLINPHMQVIFISKAYAEAIYFF